MSQSGFVHVEVDRITAETDKAFCCVIGGEQHWIPKSQMADPDDYDVGDKDLEIAVTEWIANQKGFEV